MYLKFIFLYYKILNPEDFIYKPSALTGITDTGHALGENFKNDEDTSKISNEGKTNHDI